MTGSSIENQTAQFEHQRHVRKILQRTGGEVMHPDNYDLRQEIRDAVLEAFDTVCKDRKIKSVLDRDLPQLFPAIDVLAERLWLRSVGL